MNVPFSWSALLLLFLLAVIGGAEAAPREPLRLHPENPHYFLFRGKPTVLIGSTEHYGAVLNLDFDERRYLDALKADGMNLTRTFSGVYRELPGTFKIQGNTLAPAPGRYICPWARTNEPGAADGGNKFDLQRWDNAYFDRLKSFVSEAGKRGIVVELDLFCTFYEDPLWEICPLNARNNVNGVGHVGRTEVNTLKEEALTAVQDEFVRKVAAELNGYDNLFYEICNEPYFGGPTLEWQAHIGKTLADAEGKLPHRHVIAQNIANNHQKVERPDPLVSLFNFHYAWPPQTVGENYGLNRPIGFDESGFRGTHDEPYRTEAWAFLLAGGATYDNLDYSFTAAHPDGTAPVTEPTPGGGGPMLRKQLQGLARFMRSLPFEKMHPDASIVAGRLPEGARSWALAQPGKAYGVYVLGGKAADLELAVPDGRYRAEWWNPVSGEASGHQDATAEGGKLRLSPPAYGPDVALRLTRR